AFNGVFASNLARSRETARIIVEGRNIVLRILPEFAEIDLGEWDGMLMEDIKRRFPVEYEKRGLNIADYRPPQGESFKDLQARVLPVFERLTEQLAGNILMVGHAGVNRVLICRLLGMPLENLFRINQDFAAMNVINCSKRPYRFRLINAPKITIP
ncbi:MAG: histidine phosphatase family protein, partial [Proteobacteria bacterium]|nr:histidine phosphatase family protein [Pseudomonadota bacterium]